MKKVYLLFLGVSMISASAIGQRKAIEIPDPIKTVHTLERPMQEKGATTDTTGWAGNDNFYPDFAPGAQIVNYGYQGGGYLMGSNKDSVNICAQGYENPNNSTVEIKEIIIWFSGKYDAGTGTTIPVNIYQMQAGAGWYYDAANTTWLNVEGPTGNPLASTTVAIANCDTTWPNLTPIALSAPISVTGNFAIELDASDFINSGDTIGIYGDQDGEGQDFLFWRMGTIAQGWDVLGSRLGTPGNWNAAIFAVIGDNNVGIESNEFFNGMQLSAFPVPATTNTTIAFNLERNFSKVTLKIMDAKGRVVSRTEKGALAQGKYTEVIDVTEFAAGNYYYTLYAEGTKLTKKFVVVK